MSGVAHDWVKASDLADHQAFASRFHNRFRHLSKRVDFENPLHLGEEPVQQAKVATRHPDDRRDPLRPGPRLLTDGFAPGAAEADGTTK